MLKKLVLAAAVIAGSSTAANAGTDCFLWFCFPAPTPPTKPVKAPEIDPSSAVAGLTLLAGGLAVMLGRRSRRLEVQAD